MNLREYQNFVEGVTSAESHDIVEFMNQIDRLDANYENGEHGPSVNIPLLLCGAIGLGSETGEFQEIVKKVVFQGKPLSKEAVYHMKRELGDVIWYWVNACRALGFKPNDVIEENVNKLQARYPNQQFESTRSENRVAGDL